MLDLEQCLSRIAYVGPRETNLETLRELQLAFLYHVPFENLDIHLGREITLDLDRIFDKIVKQRRGGFCYECNMLFYAMLGQLGFQVCYLSARMQTAVAIGKEFDHMILSVQLQEPYLVDVGNGQSCREPLPIKNSTTPVDYEGISYRLDRRDRENYALYSKPEDGDWQPRFLFRNKARQVSEFAGMCRFHQQSPQSHFTNHRVATIATADGRITLMDNQVAIHGADGEQNISLDTVSGYRDALHRYFGIDLPGLPETWVTTQGTGPGC